MKDPSAIAPMPPPANARAMLLSLWCSEPGVWRARLVDAEASVHDFDNPFELARFLAWPDRPGDPAAKGLR